MTVVTTVQHGILSLDYEFQIPVSSKEKNASWKVYSRRAVQEIPAVCTTCISVPCLLEFCRVLNVVFAQALSSHQNLIKGGSSVCVEFIPLRYIIPILIKSHILMPEDGQHDRNMQLIWKKLVK
jgi:hypothetical protein